MLLNLGLDAFQNKFGCLLGKGVSDRVGVSMCIKFHPNLSSNWLLGFEMFLFEEWDF